MRLTGTVRWFDLIRGLGAISHEAGGLDYLVEHSSLRGTVHHPLAAGERVEFDSIQSGAGAAARDVIRLGSVLVPATIEGSL